MVALKTERRVFLWKLTPRPNPSEAKKPVTLEEITKIVRFEYDKKRARAYLSERGRILADDDPDRDEKNQIFIANIKEDQKTLKSPAF